MRDRRRLHNKTFSRAVSLLLGLLLCLEPLSMAALAAPSQDPYDTADYPPTVWVEGNAVVSGVAEGADPTADDLTGFFEVSLKVQTVAYINDAGQQVSYEDYAAEQAAIAAAKADGTTPPTATIEKKENNIDFGMVAATLKYDANIFTPVSWSATGDIFDPDTGALRTGLTADDGLTDISGATETAYASLDAIGPEEIIYGDALVRLSDDTDGNTNILYMSARAEHENVRYAEPTAVLVVRFAYDKNKYPMLTTDADSGVYVLGVANRNDSSVVNATTGYWDDGGLAASGDEQPVLWLAEDEEAAAGYNEQSVWYDGNHYDTYGVLTTHQVAYYYYVEAEGADYLHPDEPTVTVEYTTTVSVDNPNTEGAKVLALDYDATTPGDPSYLTNVLKQDDIYTTDGSLVFQFVNKESYLTSGVNVDDVAPILFYDWDNTLLGVLVVEKGKDVRAEVNEFVSQWIHDEIIDATPDVFSLSRADNYRGKYPTTPMTEADAASDTTSVTDGGDYPLTNKLDYVFFKRPMEQVVGTTDADSDGELDPIPNQWQQKGTDDGTGTVTAEWDEDYPYVYGWASCVDENLNPDPTMVEATWTTLGMGELNSYNGSNLGGYKAIGTDPATFTYDSEEVTFTFADFEAGVDGPTYVKAVYEPGENLLTTYYGYRMVDEPYYNKLNGSAAQAGGAYSVDITYERSNSLQGDGTYADGVYGVARIREPVVRQNTTTDVKWEAEDLINSTIDDAYGGKAKVAYTKIDVENTEQIPFTLALSARHNRVDYYLADNYGNNFVSGGARTTTNNSYRTADPAAFVIDNYNYLNDESITDDRYYDASYEYRDGSHGFVLYGTLNKLMEEATKQAVDPTYTGINGYVNATVLADANIRFEDGSAPANIFEVQDIIKMLVAAAAAAKTAYDGGNDAYWNTEKDCAQLTYHQLQGFIINNDLNHDENPVTGLTWCHLHAECAADLVNKPENWEELIEAVMDDTAADLLLFPELEALAGLRSDANGTKYIDSATLIADIKAAVERMRLLDSSVTVTWDMVQGHILDNDVLSPDDAEQLSYDTAWWYEGGEKPTNLASVLEAALYASPTDPDVPVRNAKLNTLKDAFDKVAADVTDNADWNRLTDNFMAGQSSSVNEAGDPVRTVYFFDADGFDDFVENLKNAVAGLGIAAGQTNWQRVQYYLIHGEHYTSDDNAETEMADYWWYQDGQLIFDVQTMLEAAKANSATWQSFTAADLYAMKGLSFSADFAGTRWDDTNIDTFKSLVKQIAATGTGQSWYQVQYRIIHRTDATTPSGTVEDTTAQTEGLAYYWWEGGNTTAPTLTHNSDNVQNQTASRAEADTLVEMAFRIKYNGIPDPRVDSTSTNHGLDDTVLQAYRFQHKIPESTDADYTVNLFKSGDIGDLLDLLDTLLTNASNNGNGGPFAAPDLNWFQVQYALLHNGDYLAAPEADAVDWSGYDANERYWWRLKDGNPNNADTVTKFDKLLGYLYQLGEAVAKGESFSFRDAHLTDYPDMTFVEFLKDSEVSIRRTSALSYSAAPPLYLNNLETALKTELVVTIWNTYSNLVDHTNKTVNLTWAQVQYAMMYNTRGDFLDAASAATYAQENGWAAWCPDGSVVAASALSLRPTTYEDQYTAETTVSEDGLTTTVVETLGTWNDELGDYDWTITTTVTQQVGEITVTTITVTTMTYDPETWQPIFDTTTETMVSDLEVGDATYALEEDTDLTPVQPEDSDSQTPEDSDPADDTQTTTGGDQTYQPGADTQTAPVETADDGDTAADDSDTVTGALSAASAGLLSLAWRSDGTGPGISLALAGPVSSLRVTGILDTGQLFGSQRDGPLGILPSRSNLPTVTALLANRRIRT